MASTPASARASASGLPAVATERDQPGMATRPAPARPVAAGLPADPDSLLLQHEVEQLLYLEARLLDDWDLDAWLTLYTPDARYVVPTTDLPEGDPRSDLVFIDDDRDRMAARVVRLQGRHAHREYPGRAPAASSPTSW